MSSRGPISTASDEDEWRASTAASPPAPASAQRISTASDSEKPIATSLWEVWSRPPFAAERVDKSRDNVTNVVSNIGMRRISAGTATEETTRVPALAPPTHDRVARLIPRNKLPPSPMKIDAGVKL